MITVTFHKQEDIAEERFEFAVIPAKYDGKWIFCRHKLRGTWEFPGGHPSLAAPYRRSDFLIAASRDHGGILSYLRK